MNAQTKKPFEEISRYLEGKKKIVLMGCEGCATVFHTGGIKEVDEMAEKLAEEGKEVIGEIRLPFAVFTCYLPMSSMFLREHKEEIEQCDAMLMQSCGDGLQAVRGYLEEEMGTVKPIYPSNDALGFCSGDPAEFKEECQACGECELGKTFGICPFVQCPKALLNGPCGGTSEDGKCEVDPTGDCAWATIYRRAEELNQVDELLEIGEAHHWSKAVRPHKLKVEPAELMEELKGGKESCRRVGAVI